MIEFLIAHLIGDFLLQSKRMAIAKGSSSLVCMKHCNIYMLPFAFAMVIVVRRFDIDPDNSWLMAFLLYLSILIPHFIIDRWSLANKWAKMIKGRTFESIQDEYYGYESKDHLQEIARLHGDVVFTCIVYTVTDFTLHLICLWAVYMWMMTW